MISCVLCDFQPEEIDLTLSQMHPLKAPGPDGFLACFYQQHWATIGQEARRAVLSFLNSGIIDAADNNTFIALIPKASPSTKVTEFRPISLCNVLYKLIVKVLANHLKKKEKKKKICLLSFLVFRALSYLADSSPTTCWWPMRLSIQCIPS